MSKGLILCATEFEMARFLDGQKNLVKGKTPSGLIVYSGNSEETAFDCMISGPGVFNTAHALTVYLEHTRPTLVLDTGIAGGFAAFGSGGDDAGGTGAVDREPMGIGDIGIAVREQYIHTGVGCHTPNTACLPFDLIENQPLTRQGIYPADSGLSDLYHKIFTREIAGPIVRGNFITVSSITASPDHAQKIYDRFSPAMEAMEGAAAFHVAALYNVPIIEIRAASNFVGERDKDRWNFPLACEKVRQICQIVITHGFKLK
jgi:futalosine hydrolase